MDLFLFKQTGLLKSIETGCLINTSLQYYMYHSYVTQRKYITKIKNRMKRKVKNYGRE